MTEAPIKPTAVNPVNPISPVHTTHEIPVPGTHTSAPQVLVAPTPAPTYDFLPLVGTSPGRVVLVQGGFWGSESKGLVTAHVCEKYNAHAVVRTGCINAGHTVVTAKTGPVVLQTLPCGWTNPNTLLVIGPGAYIHPETLTREINLLESHGVDIRSRLKIDYRVALHLSDHMIRAKNANRHVKMGATGKGSSEAVVDKIRLRGQPTGRLLFQTPHGDPFRKYSTDTTTLLNRLVDGGGTVVLEATQGTLLDLHLGPYPYTTHKPTSPGMWLAEAGLAPSLLREVWMVVRSYPIRVAGNSGPMPGEIEWSNLARRINSRRDTYGHPPIIPETVLAAWDDTVRQVIAQHNGPPTDPSRWSEVNRALHQELLSNVHALAFARMSDKDQIALRRLFEFTTVTKKLRRVAELDPNTLYQAAMVNRPSHLFYTFANYRWPYWWYADNPADDDSCNDVPRHVLDQMRVLAGSMMTATGAEFTHMSVGPDHQLHTVAEFVR